MDGTQRVVRDRARGRARRGIDRCDQTVIPEVARGQWRTGSAAQGFPPTLRSRPVNAGRQRVCDVPDPLLVLLSPWISARFRYNAADCRLTPRRRRTP